VSGFREAYRRGAGLVPAELEAVNRALLRWYQPRRTAYPWRRNADPYRVLVSEVMLQQTQAARVAPAFDAFVALYPDAPALARATRADVLRAWGSLGYNRRAIALHEAARAIVDRFHGAVPSGVDELRSLQGVGPYTAAAVASFGFGVRTPALDVNVARVVARVRLGRDDVSRTEVAREAGRSIDRSDPGAWNQALMDLGREICRPRPRCNDCPLRSVCAFRRCGAVPGAPGRRQPAFEGSFRQVRGAVVRALRSASSMTLAGLTSDTGHSPDRVAGAVRALAAEGVVSAGPVALAGRPRGRVRLAS
jgi:A/G-specific adenine glycosylase